MIEQALRLARDAAAAAGRIMLAGLERDLRVEHKGRFDLVTQIDRACERAILDILQAGMPQAAIWAEESASGQPPQAPWLWVIDPLDGTTNYVHGYPAFCSSLALMHEGRTVLGLVSDPLRQERFEATSDGGARLNGAPIQVSRTRALEQALLSTGFPADRCDQPLTNLDRFAALTMRCQGVRRGGSAALDLCYTACGRLDGYWEYRIHAWDVAAGALIVSEAGGRVTRTDGGPFDGSGQDTLASNGLVHQDLTIALIEPPPSFSRTV